MPPSGSIRRPRLWRTAGAATCLLLGLPDTSGAAAGDLARADALWARRAEAHADGRPRPERARRVVDACRDAIAADPEDLEAHWKLLRALWFTADFTTDDRAAERALYEQALDASERAFAVLAERVGVAGWDALAGMEPEALRASLSAADRRNAAELYFWHAINLGAWSRVAGLLNAVRSGVANRLHDATLRSIALDPSVEQGGAIRLLSRLHSELPRVPLVSSWVDADRAVPLAERALGEYPDHPGNAYLLGLAILSHEPARREKALRLIEATASLEPRSDHIVEDLAIRDDARSRLEGL
jgi:hypothetical protein